MVRGANMGHQLAGGNSSWCPELESLDPAGGGWGADLAKALAVAAWRGRAARRAVPGRDLGRKRRVKAADSLGGEGGGGG